MKPHSKIFLMTNEYIQSLSIVCSHLKRRVPRSAQNLGILFDTFELVSEQGWRLKPLSQSCLQAPGFVHQSRFPTRTEDASEFLKCFLESSRSVLVDSLMDPLFTGKLPMKKNQFVPAYLIANGAAQWYIDNVLTPDLRNLLPNGEILYRDRTFHPYRALKECFDNDNKALNFYLDFFSSNLASIKTQTFYQAFENEYTSLRTLKNKEACKVQFSEFHWLTNTFYDAPSPPSLGQDLFSQTSFNDWVIAFILHIKSHQLKIKQSYRARIKLRRSIQSRAHLYSELKLCLKSPFLSLSEPDVITSLSKHLVCFGEKLQELMTMLSSGVSLTTIENQLHSCDVFYENQIRASFNKYSVVVGEQPKSSKQFNKLIALTLENIDLNFSRNSHELESVFALIKNFQNGKIDRSEFLRSPHVIDHWGTDLASVSLRRS